MRPDTDLPSLVKPLLRGGPSLLNAGVAMEQTASPVARRAELSFSFTGGEQVPTKSILFYAFV